MRQNTLFGPGAQARADDLFARTPGRQGRLSLIVMATKDTAEWQRSVALLKRQAVASCKCRARFCNPNTFLCKGPEQGRNNALCPEGSAVLTVASVKQYP